MSAERGQGRGWVRIPASRGEQPGRTGASGGPRAGAAGTATAGPSPYETPGYAPYPPYPPYAGSTYGDQTMIYMSLVKRWREAGRTLPGHPDEEWERLISQPCWPGR
ncbi:hypothetical protein [Streptomyces sp. NPDC051183]|uniref:hypothetical protein n=1 Tax=unclassified Streptomyces TaxID=2593676 RepID=UPI0034144735